MNKPAKAAAISATGLLLGLGLCGIDAKLIDQGHGEFGGPTSLWGALIILVSALALISSLIAVLLRYLLLLFRKRSGASALGKR